MMRPTLPANTRSARRSVSADAVRAHMILFFLITALFFGGCSEEDPYGELEAAIVVDRALFTVIQTFEIFVLAGTTTEGAPVTCVDIPSVYRISDTRLAILAQQNLPWNGATEEAQAQRMFVPADQRVLILVRGVSSGFVAGRGCIGDQVFFEGSENSVEVDVTATAGSPCFDDLECEQPQTCSTQFPGGYCAAIGCSSDDLGSAQACPPGSRCVDDQTGGICMQICEGNSDCRPPNHLCEARRLAGADCGPVCAPFDWNTQTKCGTQ